MTTTTTTTSKARRPRPTVDLPKELLAVRKRMRLPYLRDAAPEVLATARAQRWNPAEVLRVLITEEIRGRDEATRRMRRKAAGLAAGKTFQSWREADLSIPPGTQTGLATLEWVGRAENLAVAGPSGTGKTHFVEALAHKVIDAGMRVSWFTLESLTAAIGRATVDGSVAKTIAKITRAELIVIDDIGMLPAGKQPVRRSTASSTPPTNAAASRSPRTSTPPGSTRSCPRPWPPPPLTGCRTTPTSCSPRAPRYDCQRPPPDAG